MRKQHGFTLMELLVVLAIIGIVLSMGMGVFSQSLKTWGSGQKSSEMQQYLRYSIKTISEDIRKSPQAICTAAVGNPIHVGNTVEYSANDTGRKLIVPGSDGNAIEYSINTSNELIRSINESNNVLGSPFNTLSITTVSISERGAVYNLTLSTLEINDGNHVPQLEMQTTIFAPNITQE